MNKFLIALARIPALVAHGVTNAAPSKPNIILIYRDDHGWADLGAQGTDRDIRTPHLDALVADGVRFVNGYVTAPQCVPSRAGVITDRYLQRFGVTENGKGPLPLAELTIPEGAGFHRCATGPHIRPPCHARRIPPLIFS